ILRAGESQRVFSLQDQEQPIAPLIGPTDQGSDFTLQGFWWTLKVAFLDLHDVPDLVHEQADRAMICSQHNVDGLLAFGPLAPAEPTSQVDSRDNLTAKIDQPHHHRRSQRYRGHLLRAQNLLHLSHFDPIEEAIYEERTELLFLDHDCEPSVLAGSLRRHSDSAIVASTSRSSIS